MLVVLFTCLTLVLLVGRAGWEPANGRGGDIGKVPRATQSPRLTLPQDVFVGVAISGGGSRSANFAAAALQELEAHGFLRHASALSSVSGGSLPAAYYGLFRYSDQRQWDWEKLRRALRTDFIGLWYPGFFWPISF